MTTLPAQVISQLLINNLVPLITTSASYLASSYFTPSCEEIRRTATDDEYELDQLQMDRLLKWMKLLFEETTPYASTTETEIESKPNYNRNCIVSIERSVQTIKNMRDGKPTIRLYGCFRIIVKRIQNPLQKRSLETLNYSMKV